MTEPEIQFPVKCPICSEEVLTGFRLSVVAHALDTGDIRLYSNCHLVSWDASESEIRQIRDFLDATWSENPLLKAGEELSFHDHPEGKDLAFIFTGTFDEVDNGLS
jgi:hypothetical protein